MEKKDKMPYLQDYVKDKIKEITGFDKKNIKLLLIKRTSDGYLSRLNHYEFVYKNKTYILEKEELKCLK